MRRQFKQLMQFLYAWTLILCLTQKLFAHVQVFITYCDLGESDVMVRYTACIRQLYYTWYLLQFLVHHKPQWHFKSMYISFYHLIFCPFEQLEVAVRYICVHLNFLIMVPVLNVLTVKFSKYLCKPTGMTKHSIVNFHVKFSFAVEGLFVHATADLLYTHWSTRFFCLYLFWYLCNVKLH